MKTQIVIVLAVGMLPLLGMAQQEPAVGGKPTAGAGVAATPTATPGMTPASVPGVNDPNKAGMGTGSGKGASGNGTGTATQGGLSPQ